MVLQINSKTNTVSIFNKDEMVSSEIISTAMEISDKCKNTFRAIEVNNNLEFQLIGCIDNEVIDVLENTITSFQSEIYHFIN